MQRYYFFSTLRVFLHDIYIIYKKLRNFYSLMNTV